MSDHVNLSGTEGLKKISELIKGIQIAMMTTVAQDGSLHARPMAIQDKEFDGTLWFLTRDDSEKVKEIQDEAQVLLSLAEPKDTKYVAAKGSARVSKDRAKIHELWNPIYKAWFPKGEDDPAITVLQVNVSEAEYWEASSSKLVFGMKYLAAALTGGAIDVAESGTVKI